MVIILVFKIFTLQIILVIVLLPLRVRGLIPFVYKGLSTIQENHIPNQGDYTYDSKINLVKNLHGRNHLGHRLAPPQRPGPSCVQRIANRGQTLDRRH